MLTTCAHRIAFPVTNSQARGQFLESHHPTHPTYPSCASTKRCLKCRPDIPAVISFDVFHSSTALPLRILILHPLTIQSIDISLVLTRIAHVLDPPAAVAGRGSTSQAPVRGPLGRYLVAPCVKVPRLLHGGRTGVILCRGAHRRALRVGTLLLGVGLAGRRPVAGPAGGKCGRGEAVRGHGCECAGLGVGNCRWCLGQWKYTESLCISGLGWEWQGVRFLALHGRRRPLK